MLSMSSEHTFLASPPGLCASRRMARKVACCPPSLDTLGTVLANTLYHTLAEPVRFWRRVRIREPQKNCGMAVNHAIPFLRPHRDRLCSRRARLEETPRPPSTQLPFSLLFECSVPVSAIIRKLSSPLAHSTWRRTRAFGWVRTRKKQKKL